MKTIVGILLLMVSVFAYPQQRCNRPLASDHTWQNVGQAGFTAGQGYYTSLAFSPVDGQPYVAFVDIPQGPGNTGPGTVMKFDGTQWVNVGVAGFTGVTIGYTSLAFSLVDHLPYVAFAAGCSSTLQASVMKFDGTNWIYVGNGGFSPGTAAYTSLAFNPVNGQPYVAFMDLMNSGKVSVMKFEENNWVYVGVPDFSPGEAWFTRIAFSPAGTLYAVYQEMATTLDVTVMKFNGSSWEAVGSAGFTSGHADEIGFGVSPIDGQPYVAVDDAANFHQIKVMTFDGSNWVTVGDMGSTQGWATRMCLAFSQSGQLYVSYWDSSFPGICVKTFNGTNWINVGNTGFSAAYIDYPSFLLSASGIPYQAYMDEADSNRVTVKKYDFPTGFGEQSERGIFLYPDPVTKFLTLKFTNRDNFPKNIEIYDIGGNKMMAAQTSENKFIVNTGDYAAGMYIIKAKTEKSVYVSKFLKKN